MTENDKFEFVRSSGTKKNFPLAFCSWAAGEWSARYYAYTPTHMRQCQVSIGHMTDCASWFKKKITIDPKKSMRKKKQSD